MALPLPDSKEANGARPERSRAFNRPGRSGQLYSFDVFDTLLTRAVGSPSTVFLMLGRRLKDMGLVHCSPHSFAQARIDAERRALVNTGKADYTLSLRDIYAEMEAALGMDSLQCAPLMDVECALEAELLRPVPGALDRVNSARAAGQRVTFMSDMYLSRSFIQAQLERLGFCADGDNCYVSCEYGGSKATGKLLAEMLRTEGVTPGAVTHVGNSLSADVSAPRRMGMRVEPFTDANLDRYEQLLESYAWTTDGLSSAMAGASRLARLTVPAPDPAHRAFIDVAAGVAAPLLVGYTLWVLRRAQLLGLERLYFLSRDGQVLLEIARRLAPRLGLKCDLRYLYGSRRSWDIAAVTQVSDEQMSWVWNETDFLSVQGLLDRIGIDPDQVRGSLEAHGFTEDTWLSNLSPGRRKLLQTVIMNDARIHDLVLQKASQQRTLLVEYLRQEGLLDSVRYGMVDLGWMGSMYTALASILAGMGREPPAAFYFALIKGTAPLPQAGLVETYFFNERVGRGFIKPQRLYGGRDVSRRALGVLLEFFCSGDHGTVLGFREDRGAVVPVLREERNHRALEWGLPLLRETVCSFVDNLLLDPGLLNPWADVREATDQALRAFWLRPTRAEAEAWGRCLFEDGLGSEVHWYRLASPYTWADVARACVEPNFRPGRAWVEGSMALTPPATRTSLKAAIRLARSRRQVMARLKRSLAWLKPWRPRVLRPHRRRRL